jgi:hypothetical protein
MKRLRKILFRILLLSGIILFFGLNVYSHYTFRSNSIELSSTANNTGKSYSQDYDTYDDDQIIYTSDFSPSVELSYQIFQSDFLILKYSIFFWQPPKIS